MKAMNTPTNRRHTLLFLAILTLIATSGCNDKSDGVALPSTSAPSTTATSEPLNDLNACNVLDTALEGQGFTPAETDKAGGENGCKADKEKYGGLNLTLQPNLGIKDLNADPSKLHAGDVLGRESVQIRNGIRAEGDCAIAMAITSTSRALLSAALSTGTTEEACTFVNNIAEKVEPQLPKRN